jgi:hypothetical protein
MVWPIIDSFSGREFAADLVEEIEDEADLVHRSILFCAWGLQHGEALAVGVQIKVIGGPAVGELTGRPELGLVAVEGIAGSGVGDDHYLVVKGAIKKFVAVARPLGRYAEAGGNLPLSAWAGKGPNIHFVVTGFVGVIGQPTAIGRERWLPFEETGVHEGLWLSGLPAGLLVAFDRKSHDVPASVGVQLVERQDLAIGSPGACVFLALTLSEALGIPRAIGAYPPEVVQAHKGARFDPGNGAAIS